MSSFPPRRALRTRVPGIPAETLRVFSILTALWASCAGTVVCQAPPGPERSTDQESVLAPPSSLAPQDLPAPSAFASGEVFAAVGSGKVKRFSPSGTLLQVLDTLDTTPGSRNTTGMTWDRQGNLYLTLFTHNTSPFYGNVYKFGPTGSFLGTFGSGYNAHPESVVVDASGNVYVGQADGMRSIRKFSSTGSLLDTFYPYVDSRGADWFDLAADQRTIYYTSEGKYVRRFDLSTKTSLGPFNQTPLPGDAAFALRILPDGGVMVADKQVIVRLSSSGALVRTYDATAEDNWFALSLDPDGQTFWSGGYDSSKAYRFNLSTGQIVTSWTTSPYTVLAGLAVYGEKTQGGNVDSDADGLPDVWETYGLTLTVNGQSQFLDLPAMGANPLHKDVFIEIDWMEYPGYCTWWGWCHYGHYHIPKAEALADVVSAFASAPVPNPDGSNGITLHIDAGPGTVMNPLTGALWGDASRARGLPEQEALGSVGAAGYDWSAFEGISAVRLEAVRRPVFHYAVFAHDIGGLRGTSGMSRGAPGSDFIVSLGSWTDELGTAPEQAGTLMHELGHNLGLAHGGNENTQHKPNYLSVMNYSFQTSGLRHDGADGLLDYSRFGNLQALNESSLDENVGLGGGAALARYGTRWWCSTWWGGGSMQVTSAANGPIDWDCVGDATGRGIQADINNDRSNPPSYEVLTAFDDWANLQLTGGGIGQLGASAALPQATTFAELDWQTDSRIKREKRVIVKGPGNATTVATGLTITLSFLVRNEGWTADTYTFSIGSSSGWTSVSGVATTQTFVAGEGRHIVLQAVVPPGAAPGQEETVRLLVTSLSNPRIRDSATAVVRVIAASEAPRFGDLDGNGSVDVFDVVTMSGYIVGNLSQGVPPFGSPRLNALCNNDQEIDVFDLVTLQAYIVGNVPSLPTP